MKILVTFKTALANQERQAKKALADAYFKEHPRLNFEPRDLLEHSHRQEYVRLLKEVEDCGNPFSTGSAEGLLVAVIPNSGSHYYVILHESVLLNVPSEDFISARYVETIPSPYNDVFELSSGILSHG